jgi:hypothetical protein
MDGSSHLTGHLVLSRWTPRRAPNTRATADYFDFERVRRKLGMIGVIGMAWPSGS